MQVSLKREMKCFCPDFNPIRYALTEIGATYVSKKQQDDYIYRLIDEHSGKKTKRLKMRVENEVPKFIYIYSRTNNASSVSYDFFEIKDSQIKQVLEKILDIPVIVKKEREEWRKEGVIFNLDYVNTVGHIFEIEVDENATNSGEILKYKDKLRPYLGNDIAVSNEDLISM